MKKKIIVSGLLIFATIQSGFLFDQDFLNVNFFLQQERIKKQELLFLPNFSLHGFGRTIEGEKVNFLQYLYPTQNAFSMLKGFTLGSDKEQIIQQFVSDEDGVRGHFKVDGKFLYKKIGLQYVYHWNYEWAVSCYIPLCYSEIKDVIWKDQTSTITIEDQLMHNLITDQLETNVKQLGNLNLGKEYSKFGTGDLRCMVHWKRGFIQEKEWLKQVTVASQFGVIFPTGLRKHEDYAYSFAFGNDGALAVPFGCGIDLKFKKMFHTGIDFAFEYIFNDTKERRIITDPLQTDLLMLEKAATYKEHGVKQMFNLYIEPQLFDTVALRCAYQHIKKGNDKLYVINNDYSSNIANKAASLKEWTMHSMFVQLRYDPQGVRGTISPIISVFGQYPFNGKRSIQAPSIGCEVVLQF